MPFRSKCIKVLTIEYIFLVQTIFVNNQGLDYIVVSRQKQISMLRMCTTCEVSIVGKYITKPCISLKRKLIYKADSFSVLSNTVRSIDYSSLRTGRSYTLG